MTIDFHYHVLAPDLMNARFHRMLVHVVKRSAGSRGEKLSDEAAPAALAAMFDRDAERELQTQDEAGIDLTLLLPLDQGAHMGETDTSIWDYNKHVLDLAKRRPDRFAAFCAVEPHRPFASDLLATAVEQWGAKGLKLVPNAGFTYGEDCVMPLAEQLLAYDLPLLAHTGHWPGDPGGPYNHPSHLERLLGEFPRLRVIAAHIAGQWWRDLAAMARRHDNLYCDISCFQAGVLESYDRACHVFRRVLDGFGPERVVFASDGPSLDFWLSRKRWVDAIAQMHERSAPGVRFTPEEIQGVLHDNAARLLKLSPVPSLP